MCVLNAAAPKGPAFSFSNYYSTMMVSWQYHDKMDKIANIFI